MTKSSYRDRYSEGFADARSGTGYSVNLDPDHTVVYKEGYANGYRDSLGGESISTHSHAQAQTLRQGTDIHMEQSQARSRSQH